MRQPVIYTERDKSCAKCREIKPKVEFRAAGKYLQSYCIKCEDKKHIDNYIHIKKKIKRDSFGKECSKCNTYYLFNDYYYVSKKLGTFRSYCRFCSYQMSKPKNEILKLKRIEQSKIKAVENAIKILIEQGYVIKRKSR